MLPTQLLWLCNPVAHAFQVPALCKVRKGRGTHYVFGASEVKSLGHPAIIQFRKSLTTEVTEDTEDTVETHAFVVRCSVRRPLTGGMTLG